MCTSINCSKPVRCKYLCKTCYNRSWREKNKELNYERLRVWSLANKKRTRELDRLRYKRDRVKRLALIQQREKRLRQMTPSWLSKDQRSEILEIYRNRPVGHQVDHIIPLKGQNVWGFHVPWNLQYLTAEENNRKSNNV